MASYTQAKSSGCRCMVSMCWAWCFRAGLEPLTPAFCSTADLRLQLLDVKNNPYLIKALYGLLMLLPQSSAFQLLSHRLQCVPNPELLQTE